MEWWFYFVCFMYGKAKMSSRSKSNRKKATKLQSVPKVKESFKNWLDLPSDLLASILHRIGVIDILENAQKVCTTWRKICKEPAMWKVIHMDTASCSHTRAQLRVMCKNAVDRSQGQLVDISILGFCNNELLKYIADRYVDFIFVYFCAYYRNQKCLWVLYFLIAWCLADLFICYKIWTWIAILQYTYTYIHT